MSEACIAGGVTAIEVAFTTPRAHEAILTLSEKYKDNAQVVIGAGTVLDAETARMAILNGAAFVVSPAFDEATIKLCNRYRVACMPGTTTIQGVIQALELGADIVKVFPGEVMGSKFIKAVKGPLPQAQMMPTGGVSIDNVAEWFKAGAVAVGAGGALTGGGKSLTEITETAKKIVVAVAEARK
nr:bifunctional 2-keto-4-hydroxyglutarate aldolase/2-keto-3-deoxy-6-phosphogluconate aldolase [uncultured Veillonella sp.]